MPFRIVFLIIFHPWWYKKEEEENRTRIIKFHYEFCVACAVDSFSRMCVCVCVYVYRTCRFSQLFDLVMSLRQIFCKISLAKWSDMCVRELRIFMACWAATFFSRVSFKRIYWWAEEKRERKEEEWKTRWIWYFRNECYFFLESANKGKKGVCVFLISLFLVVFCSCVWKWWERKKCNLSSSSTENVVFNICRYRLRAKPIIPKMSNYL